ncbi:MAG: hypothetical protein IIB62_13105, partial [Proteobacteria bacterium]|nr:hypothetical protein [Pseudomonadota bacterium]
MKSGRIPCENGKIPVDAADSTLGILGNGSAPSRPGEDLQRARCDHEIYKAKRAKLNYEQAVANTLRTDDVRQAMKQLGEILYREVNKLESHTRTITKIAKTGDLKALRTALKNISREMRQSITVALTGD